MNKLSYKEKVFLIVFVAFVTIFELYHVAIDTNPPTILRVAYAFIYLLFAFASPSLIPIYTVVNLIVERFSSSFGEFLPNTLLFHIAVLTFGILCVRYKGNMSPVKSYNHKSLLWFYILYIYAIASLVLHVDIAPDFNFLINGAFMFVFLYFLTISKDKYLINLLKYAIVAISIVCLIGLFNYDNLVGEYGTSLGDVERLEWKDANYFSFFIGLMLLITLYLARSSHSKGTQRLYTGVALLLLITMASLISRGAIVALALSVIYYYRKDLLRWRNLGYLLFVVIAIGGLYYAGVLDGLIMRFMSEDVQTGSGRTDIWEVGINTFFNKNSATILFGAGEGQASSMAYMNGTYWSPHNNYLSVLYEYGVIGVMFFCIWLCSMFLYAKKRESRALMIFIIVNCMTIVPFTYVAPIWFVIPVILIWDKRLSKIMQ